LYCPFPVTTQVVLHSSLQLPLFVRAGHASADFRIAHAAAADRHHAVPIRTEL
jgi:hypothetical protein